MPCPAPPRYGSVIFLLWRSESTKEFTKSDQFAFRMMLLDQELSFKDEKLNLFVISWETWMQGGQMVLIGIG